MSFNPKRLEQARRRRGISRRALSERTGIAERTLAYNESGDHPPSDNNLRTLAQVLGFPLGFFSLPDPEPLPKDSVSFRALSRMTAGQRDRALAGGELALELNAWLEDRFDLPKPDLPDLRPNGRDPESASEVLRSYWSLGDRPIANMIYLLEKHGVRVFSLAEDNDALDAFSFWRADKPFVFLNTMKSGERSRFDAAHELGHLVLHDHGTPRGRGAEHEADTFAAAFLMPKSSVNANHPKLKSLPGMIHAKQHWGVSVLALAKRMKDSGLLSDWRYRQVCIEVQQTGLRKREPNPIPRESSQVLAKVFQTLWAEKTPPHKVAAEMAWPKAELDALTFQLVNVSHDRPKDGQTGLRVV